MADSDQLQHMKKATAAVKRLLKLGSLLCFHEQHNDRAARFTQALIDYTVELGMKSVELPEVEIDPDDFSKCLSPYEAVKKVEGTGPSATRLRAAVSLLASLKIARRLGFRHLHIQRCTSV
mmetsp:Transcript_33193/g.79118  ORF Transcript_33193/g.79118 Transcript_33193/m.79118 type:complete len:121 (+) Transcript_33193:419-781(+)